MTTLVPNEPAPALSISTTAGTAWTLSDQKPGTFTMIVFYRGQHCPVCKSYLTELERRLPEFEAAGASVIAVSMDTEERARASVSDWGLDRLTVGYGLGEAEARGWGLYLSKAIKETEPGTFSEPGLFLIDPEGKLYLINISNMPFARPQLEGLADKLTFASEKAYPARGIAA